MRSCGYVQVLKTALSQVSPHVLLRLKKMHIRIYFYILFNVCVAEAEMWTSESTLGIIFRSFFPLLINLRAVPTN